jgi:hypothetical protein
MKYFHGKYLKELQRFKTYYYFIGLNLLCFTANVLHLVW